MNASAIRRLLLSVIMLVVAALFAAACGDDGSDGGSGSGASGSGSDKQACGATKDGSTQIVRHCGTASGEVTVDDAKVQLEQGACQNTDKSIVVNLGANVVSANPTEAQMRQYPYIGLLAGQHPAATPQSPAVSADGTFKEGVFLSAVVGGRSIALPAAQLELSDNRTEGSFSGTGTNGEKVSGSFTCG